jgi:quinoprotein glucose dehydrogenase
LAEAGYGSCMLGGSFFYLFAGIMFLLTAFLLLKRKASALWVYAALIVVSLIWAIYEVGFDWWQLGPRGGLIILLGLWLLTPWIRRPLGFSGTTGTAYAASPWPLAVPVLAAIVIAGYSMTTSPHDQHGDLPTAMTGSTTFGGTVTDGEWHQYGRTPFGQRYSPLEQINVSNVKRPERSLALPDGRREAP